jgi:hypothetical protein
MLSFRPPHKGVVDFVDSVEYIIRMLKTKPSPKKTDDDFQRLQLAHKRIGGNPAARLKWLLDFKDRDLNLLHPGEREALSYDLKAFISYGGGELVTTFDSLKPVPSGLVTEIQAEVRQGFANLYPATYINLDSNTTSTAEVWNFPRPEQVFLQRTSPDNAKRSKIELRMSLVSVKEGQNKERRIFVDPKVAILYGILNTIREGQNLLRACSECKAPFIPVQRQEYCSTKCSQKARDRRRKKTPK